MKKIFFTGIISIFTLALCQNIYAAKSSSVKPLARVYKKAIQPEIKIDKSTNIINWQWDVITIGWTDACGHCWEYSITGPTWAAIWAIVYQLDAIYESGFCGYVTFYQ